MALRSLWDVPAPAKLNLFLHLIGRRADGYHLLQSAFMLIDWADALHFEKRDDGRLLRHDLGLALPDDDLCLRAARALQTASASLLGADIHIHKHVPSGAGMGGGSSDAASTLLALNRLWGLHWPRERLAAIALTLGADVPFFIGGGNAFVEGIGETLTPIDLPVARYAVLKPAASLPTRDIFSHPALRRDTPAAIVEGYPQGNPNCTVWAPAHGDFGNNDLQAAAEDRCPEVAQAARWLEGRFGNSRMTGSGSAVFSRIEVDDVADVDSGIAAAHEATFPAEALPRGWVGRMCRSLTSHPLRDWAG